MSEKMHKTVGEKGYNYDAPIGEKPKEVRILPTVRLTDEDLPELKDWKVGEKYKLVIEVEQMSVRQGNEYSQNSSDKRMHAQFKITKVGVEDSKPKKQTTGKAFELEYAQKRNGYGTGSRYDKPQS